MCICTSASFRSSDKTVDTDQATQQTRKMTQFSMFFFLVKLCREIWEKKGKKGPTSVYQRGIRVIKIRLNALLSQFSVWRNLRNSRNIFQLNKNAFVNELTISISEQLGPFYSCILRHSPRWMSHFESISKSPPLPLQLLHRAILGFFIH